MNREEFRRLYSESEEFPGLRLNVPAMVAQDREAVLRA